MHGPRAAIAPLLVVLALGTETAHVGASAAQQQPAADPRAVVQEATRAAEAGTTSELRRRLEARLRADPADRAALLGVATIARLTYDYEAAERGYRRLFEGTPAGDRYAIYGRLGLAEGMETEGRKSGQQELLDLARAGARTAGDGAAEGAALFWQSMAFGPVYGGDYVVAKTDSALRVLPEAASDVRAASRCRRAQITGMTGGAGAADSIAAATDFARRSGGSAALAICLRARAVHQIVRGFGDSSLVTFDSLIALRRRVHDRANLAAALMMSGDSHRGRGDMGRALPRFREALGEARASRNQYVEATVTLGMGGIALALNDHATAATNLRHAVAAYEAAGDSGSAMHARSFLPFVSLAVGDYPRARREVRAVLPWAWQIEDWAHVRELYTLLAAIEMRATDFPAAARALDSAAIAARRLGPSGENELLFPRGRLALARGDLAAAERAFTRHLAGLDSTRHIERYETRAYLADVHARRGDLARAERELTTAGDDLDAWRAGLADEELRTLAFQAGATETNDRNASVARVLAALARGGRAEAAFALAERRRARELSERLVRVRAFGGPDTTRHARDVAGGATTASAIAAAIPDERTAVLEYVTGVMGAPTTLLAIARRGDGSGSTVRAVVLPPADSLIDDVARFDALVGQGGDPGALGRTLAATLLDSALAHLPPSVTRLVVVPDGPLHRVPWDALQLADGHYVAERYAVSVAPSATVLAQLWRRGEARTRERDAAGPGPVRLLAFGDPTFAGERDVATTADAETYRSAFDSAGGLPRLEGSAREARLVARYADDGEVRLREKASASYLKHAPLARYRVVHLATHALVDERAMTRTALALAPGGGEDGFVGPSELAALPLDADLVVLSACRSAGGVVVDGEGVQGLTAPLLEAGARSVVATGWRIGDRSTVQFVDDFYAALARGLPVGDALRAAKVAAILRGAPPREWAAFVAVGDPLVTIPLHAPGSGAPLRVLVAGALALAVAGIVAARRRSHP